MLPRWCAGIEAATLPEAIRDILWIGVYTGMRLDEARSLRWEWIDLEKKILWVDETRTGEVLELPITRQLAAILRAATNCAQRNQWWLTGGCSRRS